MPYAAPGLHKARKAEIARSYRARKKHLRLHPLDATPSEMVADLALAKRWSRAWHREVKRLGYGRKRERPSAISATSVLKHRRINTGGAS